MEKYINNSEKSDETAIFWKDLKSGRFASMVQESSKGNTVSNVREVCNIMKPFFAKHDDIEKVYCIFLDAKNKIIAIEKIFSGTITTASVYPREIVKKVLELKAAAIILSHNHPSGCETPSSTDFMITAIVGVALSSIDVALHDHLIIGENHYSFAEQGWLVKVKQKYDDFISSTKHIM
ncbi:JAB domain-containing protein [Desulfobacterales bacterium HSG17]|nr:JAB domain-containing protein [Desulfobacterales bacterium HSG17]